MNKELRYSRILMRDFRTVRDGKVINFNIGTSAHAPGTIAVLRRFLPGIPVALWTAAPLAPELKQMMLKRFPDVPLLEGGSWEGDAADPVLSQAVRDAEMFLIPSGEGIAESTAAPFRAIHEKSGTPGCAYAIGCSKKLLPILSMLDSVSCRDKEALKLAAAAETPVKLWAPDAVFFFDCADEEFADDFLKRHTLTPGCFICVIPGWRHTPRWRYGMGTLDEEKERTNEAHKEHDLALLRETILCAVRKHHVKVLLCAENLPEMELLPELLETLPAEVRNECRVLPELWGPDQALGVYKRSLLVCGIEMHSQVMALGNGVPAAVFRHRGFGTKSSMWRDIGLSEWLLDIDDAGSARKAGAIIDEILSHPEQSRAKVQRSLKIIEEASRKAVAIQFGVK